MLHRVDSIEKQRIPILSLSRLRSLPITMMMIMIMMAMMMMIVMMMMMMMMMMMIAMLMIPSEWKKMMLEKK
jgi:hypothetical protein